MPAPVMVKVHAEDESLIVWTVRKQLRSVVARFSRVFMTGPIAGLNLPVREKTAPQRTGFAAATPDLEARHGSSG